MTFFIFLGIGLYLISAVLAQWVPLLAVWRNRRQKINPALLSHDPKTLFCVVVPVKHAIHSLPWMIQCLQQQEYPTALMRVIFVVDRMNDLEDLGAIESLVSAAGYEIFIRDRPAIRTKSQALNDVLAQRIQHLPCDAVAFFDVDARFNAQYLRVAAFHLESGVSLLQGATQSKNPSQSTFTRIGDWVQAVIRLHQQGRALLGLEPWIIGSHGVVVNRVSLVHMNWQICNGRHLGDDLELNLKRILLGIPAIYVPDLLVTNDLPANARTLRLQRRRWVALTYEALFEFCAPMLRRGLSGHWRVLESLFSLLLWPVFASLFITLGLTMGICAFLVLWLPQLWPVTGMLGGLWLLDALYFVTAFSLLGIRVHWRDGLGLLRFLVIRLRAIVEGLQIAGSHSAERRWPTHHLGDQELTAHEVSGGKR